MTVNADQSDEQTAPYRSRTLDVRQVSLRALGRRRTPAEPPAAGAGEFNSSI